VIALILAIVAGVSGLIGWRAAWSRAGAQMRRELGLARADMRREVNHWQEVAERATAETARVTREAEAYKDGRKDGREDVISIMPLLVAAQQRPAPEARASGGEGR
jgi:hypothetical protein